MSVTFQQLEQACHLLFGPKTPVSAEFIRYLQPSGLKSAFRALAMENHPDRAAALALSADVLARRFKDIRQAYDLLTPYVAGDKIIPEPLLINISGQALRSRPNQRPQPAAASRTQEPPRSSRAKKKSPPPRQDSPGGPDFFYQGNIPDRRLRFGQFLYYGRVISWNTLIAAIVWQKSSRPRLGDIAQNKGWIQDWQGRLIWQGMQADEFWGEAAIRLGVLTQQQVRALLGWQRIEGQPIGKFFRDWGYLSEPLLKKHLREHILHNYRIDLAATRQRHTA